MPDISTINKEALAPAGAIPPTNHSGWLEQLESAQWQQRLRYTPGGGQQPSRDGTASAQPQDKRGPESVAGATLDARSHARAHRAEMPTPLNGAAVHAVPGHHSSRETQPTPALAFASSFTQRSAAPANEQGTAMPQHMKRLPMATWQAQHTHVMLSAEGLRVWLRDARYQGSDGYQLLRGMREQFARLGLRLAQFTLNGTQVSEPQRID
jgi:hypothetical protein